MSWRRPDGHRRRKKKRFMTTSAGKRAKVILGGGRSSFLPINQTEATARYKLKKKVLISNSNVFKKASIE
jgi:hypothetical protein